MSKLDDKIEQRARKFTEMQTILEDVQGEDRDFTDDEQARFNRVKDELRQLDRQIENLRALDKGADPFFKGSTLRRSIPSPPDMRDMDDLSGRTRSDRRGTASATARWMDPHTGKELRTVSGRGERLCEATSADFGCAHPIGRLIRSKAIGDPSICSRELRDMSEAVNTGGGFLVGDVLSDRVIDLLRQQTFVSELGVTTMALDSEHTTIARIESNPTVELHGEGVAFGGSDAGIGGVQLVTKTVGQVVYLSRELAQDAVNGEMLIERALIQAVGDQLETWILNGDGSGEPVGIISDPGIGNTVTSVGTPHWDDLVRGMRLCMDDDARGVNGYIVSPTTWETLWTTKTGDGSTSAANYLPPPKPLANLTEIATSACPNANGVVGDFTQLILGIRQQPLIEVSTDAKFAEHQLAIKVSMRFAYALAQPNAFAVLSGIS